MVAPISSLVPPDSLALYQSIIRRAIGVFTALIALYEPDIRSERDWADITVSEATPAPGVAIALADNRTAGEGIR